MKLAKDAYQGFQGLPGWAKGIIAVATTGVVVVLGSKAYKALFPSDAAKAARDLLKNVNTEIDAAKQKGLTPSYPDSMYDSFANTCYEGMKYTVSDDYGSVADTLKKMNNDLDVAKLIKAFGARQDYTFGIPEGSPKDLFTFVRSELGSEWGGLTSYRITSINKDWKGKGISYQI
jgi:hypothetical protein